MIATLMLPLAPMLTVLPFLGIVLNGTSSVLYATVPDLAPKGDIGTDLLRHDCRSFQSYRRYRDRGFDSRRHHTSDSRAPAHLGKQAQCTGRATTALEIERN
jgi:hypothetical protein